MKPGFYVFFTQSLETQYFLQDFICLKEVVQIAVKITLSVLQEVTSFLKIPLLFIKKAHLSKHVVESSQASDNHRFVNR